MTWVQWNIGAPSALVDEMAVFGYPTYFLLDGSRTIRNRLAVLPESFKDEIRALVLEQEQKLAVAADSAGALQSLRNPGNRIQ